MSRYRKVEVRTWGDEKFRRLSPIPPCAQGLWFFLITGPFTGVIPGLFRAGQAAMAEELGWELEAFQKAFQEVFQEGMVKADFKARLVWIPNALKHNKPASPNVVTGWGKEFDLLPECGLKLDAYEHLKASVYALGEAYKKAFDNSFAKPLLKPFRKTLPNQEQEQEQEQNITPRTPQPVDNPDNPEKPEIADNVKISMAFRKAGVNSQPADPRIMALADQGVDVNTVIAACEEAKKSNQSGRISVGYVVKILERWADEAKSIDVKGARDSPKQNDPWWESASGIQRKGEEIGVLPLPGEQFPDYKRRILEKIEEMKRA